MLQFASSQNVEPGEREPTLLMVCAHEPTADPRIDWEASSAARDFDVTVLGLAAENGGHPDVQKPVTYRIIRLQRSSVGMVRYLWLMKDAAPGAASAVLAILIVLGYPLLMLTEAALSFAGKVTGHHAPSLPSGSLPDLQGSSGSSFSGLLNSLRDSMLG